MNKFLYRVANPRNLVLAFDEEGNANYPHNKAGKVRILRGEYGGVEHEWFDGDQFDPPDQMPPEHVQDLLDRGFIVEEAVDARRSRKPKEAE